MKKFLELNRKIFSIALFAVSLILTGSTTVFPQSPTPGPNNDVPGSLVRIVRPDIVIPKFSVSPVIDGKVDDEVWKQAAVLKDFIQTNPGDNITASKSTEVYIGYDESHFYVAFKCWDEKDKIRSSIVQRDQIFGADNVRFWLDTYGDKRRAYLFGFNPLGIQADGIETEGQGVDFDVDVVFESKGVIEDWGWSVEAKIPFKSIRYTAGKGKFWGINAARSIARLNDESDSWVPLPRGVPGFLTKFGRISGLDEIKTERTLEIIPTATLKETGRRVSQTRFSNPPIQPDFGVTIKYSISPNVTLDAAINPDFADTEADAPVVEANQRFPIYFSEKRPFFLEGVDIFRTSIDAVYTRQIENPVVAVKLTGKTGRNSFGILGAVDDPLFNEFDKKAYVGVVRLKRDLGEESNIGFLGTTYSYPEKHNHVAGFDGRWKIDKQSEFSGQILGSISRTFFYNPDKDTSDFRTGKGVSFEYGYEHDSRNFNWEVGGGGTSPDFRSDVGFTRQTNSMQNYGSARWRADNKPNAFVIQKSIGTSFGIRNDFNGRMQGWGTDVNVNLGFKGNAEMGGGFSFGPEWIYEDEFGPRRNASQNGAFFGEPMREAFQYGGFFYTYKQINKRVSVNADLGLSANNFDYDFGAGRRFPRVSQAALADPDSALDPGPGTSLNFGTGVSLKPTDKFSLGLRYSKSKLRRNDTGLLVFDSNNFSMNSTYQFSRFVNFKARLDYGTLSGRVFGQYTFAWTPSPGKALYIGYNDNWNYKGYVFNRDQTGFLQLNRTFFIKLSYLFRHSF